MIPLCYFTITTYAAVPQAQPSALRADMLSSSDRTTLNDSSTLHISTNASSSSLILPEIGVSCFDARDFRPTSKINYFAAVQEILTRQDVLVPRLFYLGPDPRLRWEWLGGTMRGDERECGIVLANQLPLTTDAFPLVLVAHVAALIADRCVTEENGYAGGWASPGPDRGVVTVGFYDRDVAPRDRRYSGGTV